MNRLTPIIIVLWLAGSIFNYCGVCAYKDWMSEHEWPQSSDQHKVREDQAFAVFMSIAPPWWLVSAVFTGGYQDGFRWNVRPSSYYGGPVR
jgi:hypothetical protein